MEKAINHSRIWEIDFLRGIAILLMVIDHFCWDFANAYQFFVNYNEINNAFMNNLSDFCYIIYYSDVKYVFHCIFVALFFTLSGISCSFSKNNLKRGIKILLACFLLDSITYALYFISGKSIDVRMIFNVLLPLGIGTLLNYLLSIINSRYNKYIALGLAIIILFISIIFGLFNRAEGIYEITWSDVPCILISKKMFGSDCFGLIPYIGFSFLGFYIGHTFYNKKESMLPNLDGAWNKPVCFIGRNTIWIYLLHQVVLALLLIIVGLCLGYRLF